MKHILTFLSFLLISFLSLAQSKYGHLTIVSEENEPFFLYLNGTRYNDNPLTVIRVEELTHTNYNVKIEYANKRIAPVVVDKLFVADYDGYMQDITYLVSTKRRGTQALMVYKILPMDDIGIDVEREELYIWGRPGRPYRKSSTGTRTGMRTRKPTFRDSDRRKWDDDKRDRRHNDVPVCPIMKDSDFSAALSTIQNTTFENDKYNVAISLFKFHCMTTDQIMLIINQLTYDATKVKFAKYAYDYCADPQNYFKVVNTLTYSSSKNEVMDYINSK